VGGKGSTLDNIQRLVKRPATVKEADVDLARARVLERLAAMSERPRPGEIGESRSGATGGPRTLTSVRQAGGLTPDDVSRHDEVATNDSHTNDSHTTDANEADGGMTVVSTTVVATTAFAATVIETTDMSSHAFDPESGPDAFAAAEAELGELVLEERTEERTLLTLIAADPIADPEPEDDDSTPLMVMLDARRRAEAAGSGSVEAQDETADGAADVDPSAQAGLFTFDPRDGSDGNDEAPADRSGLRATFIVDQDDLDQADDEADSTAGGVGGRVASIAYCPYCATSLLPPPKSSRKCAECRQRIVVKHLDDRTVYLAEAAVPVFEAERRRLATLQDQREQRAFWLDLALKSGAPADKVAKATGEPPSDGRVAAARALFLSTVDRAFSVAADADHWEEAARIRYEEAIALFDYAGSPVPAGEEA
jgi:hypothetical protein